MQYSTGTLLVSRVFKVSHIKSIVWMIESSCSAQSYYFFWPMAHQVTLSCQKPDGLYFRSRIPHAITFSELHTPEFPTQELWFSACKVHGGYPRSHSILRPSGRSAEYEGPTMNFKCQIKNSQRHRNTIPGANIIAYIYALLSRIVRKLIMLWTDCCQFGVVSLGHGINGQQHLIGWSSPFPVILFGTMYCRVLYHCFPGRSRCHSVLHKPLRTKKMFNWLKSMEVS